MLKQAFKIDNEDQEIEIVLQEVMMINRGGRARSEMHEDQGMNDLDNNDAKKNEKWEGRPISTGALMTDIQIKHNDPIIKQVHDNILKNANAKKEYTLEF